MGGKNRRQMENYHTGAVPQLHDGVAALSEGVNGSHKGLARGVSPLATRVRVAAGIFIPATAARRTLTVVP
jgi:hypothetical protein